jgi:serine/threonine protein kinase
LADDLVLLPGDQLGRGLIIEAPAGRGGSAAVYRARRAATGERVAIKLLGRDADVDWARLERERAALAAIDHPGIIRVLELERDDDGARYAVLPWCDGVSLARQLADPGVTAAEAVAAIADAAAVLALAHDHGVVHRDLKPGHLWRRPDGTAAIIDFGIARGARADRLTRTGTAVGTPGYMAPEQIVGGAVDPRADVFALGCILYEALTGAAAFAGSHVAILQGKILWTEPTALTARCPEAPPALAALVATMLAKAADDRPADAGAVAAALRALPALAPGPRRRRTADELPTCSLATPVTVAVGLPDGRALGPASGPAVTLTDGTTIALVPDPPPPDLAAALGAGRTVVAARTSDVGAALDHCTRAALRAAAGGSGRAPTPPAGVLPLELPPCP